MNEYYKVLRERNPLWHRPNFEILYYRYCNIFIQILKHVFVQYHRAINLIALQSFPKFHNVYVRSHYLI